MPIKQYPERDGCSKRLTEQHWEYVPQLGSDSLDGRIDKPCHCPRPCRRQYVDHSHRGGKLDKTGSCLSLRVFPS